MVVVAIIGVLAAIAVPAVNKYIAKARQSEAKTNLASLYTSEKAFYAEYTTFDSRFAAIGYSPEGQLRYNVGFTAQGQTASTLNGYNGTPATTTFTTLTYCPASTTSGCTMLNGATGVPNTVALATNSTTAAAVFTASAAALIHSGKTIGDVWTMSDTKILRNVTNGIP
jgi:type IV pilus assembly protein PilA